MAEPPAHLKDFVQVHNAAASASSVNPAAAT